MYLKCLSPCILRFAVLFLIIVSSVVSPNAFGKDKCALDVLPDMELRSSVHSVDGYAYLSEDMTIADTRAAAIANAKRKALEMGKTYIKSKTKIENFVTTYDLIWSEAEGAVSIIEEKDHGVVDNKRYHVWIKAEVEYELQPKKTLAKSLEMREGYPLTVKVWTAKKEYKDSENIEIFIQGNRDFYARVVDISPNSNIIQLLPNDYRQLNFFKAGTTYKIPDQGDRFKMTVRPPYGEDQIVVYASEVPIGRVDMENEGKGLSSFKGTRKAFAIKTRGIAVEPVDHGIEAGAEFYEASWKFRTGK